MSSGDELYFLPDSQLHTLAGAYVLDAVTEAERAAFTRHLADCSACRHEIREFREAAALLGASNQAKPRPELKASSLRAIRHTSQLAPQGREGEAGPRPPTLGQPWPDGQASRRRPQFLARVTIAAAAFLITAGGVVGALMHDQMQQLSQSQRQSRMIAQVLNAPDRTMLTAKVSSGGQATVVLSKRQRALVFTAHGLRSLPVTQSYELWLMGPRGDRPAGMLAVQGGMAGPAVVSGFGAGDMIGVTVEPASGSAAPTSAPVVMIATVS
jgi:anti-sigma-K factor RskA